MDSYKIVADAVRAFWVEHGPRDVIAFFYQKYEWEKEWGWCEELVECYSDSDFETVTFLCDFCEGQTCVKDITIVPLYEVTDFYAESKIKPKERTPDES